MSSRRHFMGALGAGVFGSLGLFAGGCAVRADAGPTKHPDGKTDWGAVRGQFMYPAELAYFNTGTLGALPRPVFDAFVGHVESIERELPSFDYRPDSPRPLAGYDQATDERTALANLINASTEEICLTHNATMGMNTAAYGLRLEPGDEILMTDQEHPGGIGPWKVQGIRRGVTIRQVEIEPVKDDPAAIVKAFASAITDKTRVLMASHVLSALGIKLPGRELCELARSRGLVSILDGAQAIGQMRVDVRELGCDFYINSPHKWLCAPKGSGFLYARKELLPDLLPMFGSAQFENLEWGAQRLVQYGTYNLAQRTGLMAAIDFQRDIGIDAIEGRVRALALRLRKGLADIPGVRLASSSHEQSITGITTFKVEKTASPAVMDALWASDIRVRSLGKAENDRGVRASVHYYCNEAEVDRLLEVVGSLA